METKIVTVNQTKIILTDISEGRGEIKLSDPLMGYFYYQWGAMGSDISEFITTVNDDYFAGCLSKKRMVFSPKKSVRNIRKHIRESGDLPWWEFMEAQKEFRIKLRELEEIRSIDRFCDECSSISRNMWLIGMDFKEEQEFKSIVKDLLSEPWHHVEEVESRESKWLRTIHDKIKSKING